VPFSLRLSLDDLRARAQSAGVPGGETPPLAEAQAKARVAEWRVRAIEAERLGLAQPPTGRSAAAAAVSGCRVLVHGGFTGSLALQQLLALDLELPDERQRRLADAFAVRLDKEVRVPGGAFVLV